MDIKLAIVIPTGGTVKTDTVQCLVSSIVTLKCCKMITFLNSGYRYQNVNIGIQKAKDAGMTHVFILDADMVFEPDYIQRLLDADKDIIGGSYNEKRLPLNSTIKMDDNDDSIVYLGLEKDVSDIFEVDALGGGFMMIKMSVFEALHTPYFQAPSGKTIDDFTTEDYWFARKAKKAGFKLWCDPTLKLKHCGDYWY